MKVSKNQSKEFTISNLFRNTFEYIFENWKNIILLFGTIFLLAECILWGLDSLVGYFEGQGVFSSILTTLLALILEVTFFPFVVWNKPVPSLGGLRSYSQEFCAPSRKALLWLFDRCLILMMAISVGSLVLSIVLPFWLFVLVGSLWGLLVFVVAIRTSFLGPILACGDSSKGWNSVRASWKILKGLTFKMSVTYFLVYLPSGLVSLVLILGRATLFEVIDEGTMELGTRILFSCTDAMIAVVMTVPAIVFVGVAYRLKRDEVLAWIKGD